MKRALDNSSSSVEEVDGKKHRYDSTCKKPIMNTLYTALKLGANLEGIKLMLHDINDLNVGFSYNCRSVLHHAVSSNCELVVVEQLIKNGANINARDIFGTTPLHLAVTCNKASEFVPKLLALGADVNARNQSGETPLYLAVKQFKKFDVIKILLEFGADTEYVYDDFLTALGLFLEKSAVLGTVVLATSCAKIFIKIIFLKNFVNNFSKVLKLKEDSRINWCGDLRKFMVKCIRELGLMQTTKISSFHSVFDFALFGNNCYPKPLYADLDINDSELTTMFPIYNDVIKHTIGLALQRGQWINQFKDLQTYRISKKDDSEGREKEVILNFDCIEKICYYLTNQQLHNFLKAFQVSSEI
ncbi:putative ankyrin repeat protein RF_0381 [Halyomorpha halys]|uniref:putative ankyrin repeat protein RF_0381 n=1 Tax=Halyomorpha halys TaxID=286706 RepID=UPI0006D528DB|nr:uncharacterized protein LOC106692913 [Halyomorpha halys]